MSSNLLFVPYRKTQRIEFGEQLRDIISKEYYQTATVFEDDLKEIDILRNDVLDLTVTTQDLALLKRYYIHLTTLETKFPKDVVEFPWYGTLGYNVTGPVKIKSILFEKINIIYNIAALYTQLGNDQNRNSDEGLKKACLYFQYAATYFGYINKLATEDDDLKLPLDLQKNTIEALYYLFLAQAQEVFWKKALGDKLKDSLIGRLAIQVSDYYEIALQLVNRSEGIRTEWVHHMNIKRYHFEAAAEYRAALVSVSNAKYGEEVGHLEKAFKAIKNASSNLKFGSNYVKQDFDGLSKIVEDTLKRAEKDNDLIYLQDVPDNLPNIVKAPVTKEMNIDEIRNPFESIKTGTYGKLLFKDLLPFYVIQAAESYRERQEEYIQRHIINPVRALTVILNKFLFERGLPSSVDVVDKPQSVPQSVIDMSQEVKTYGGISKILSILQDISKLSTDGENLLIGAKERLHLESQEDDLLRSRQGSDYWTRDKSEVVSKPYNDRIDELATYLAQAREGDKTVRSQVDKIKDLLEILSGPERQIYEFIPNSKIVELDPSLRRVISQLKDLLSKGKKFEIDRETFIGSVEIKSRQSNILPKIISEYKSIQSSSKDLKIDSSTFEPVFEGHMKIFGKELEYLEKEKDKQRELEVQIDETNKKFKHFNSLQGSNSDRQKIIKKLDLTYIEFKELIDNLSQGLKFYNDFNSNCSRLIEDIDLFVYKRRIEARDLENELSIKFQQLKVNSSPEKRAQNSPFQKEFDAPQRTQSPSLVSPAAKSAARSKFVGGAWNPENGIKFS
ncbi:hypothetical protein WICMUC_005680 [Wickerhamomyces mucosus]|uniref:BRO1 domain-containing protein n=1 Tax=Wickerhamomyces mucosus TaxID=1378264 RepID=A0A9P8P6V8_9ASCO|nr:hypothetical protein WICMUC_005680 [Wickerhamomyces mucosus]